MLVTEITEHNKTKYKIYVDYEFAFVLYKGELHKYRLKAGEPIAENVYRELTEEILPKRAKLRAMNLLTKRPYTERKLREKLEEGLYSPACMDAAIDYVKSFGYLDDKAYAADYIAYHMSSQSRRVMEQKLMQKGIDAKLIRECLDEIDLHECEEVEKEQIRSLFMKKCKGKIPQENAEKTKLINFFVRKGYTVSTVKRALEELSLDDLYNQE